MNIATAASLGIIPPFGMGTAVRGVRMIDGTVMTAWRYQQGTDDLWWITYGKDGNRIRMYGAGPVGRALIWDTIETEAAHRGQPATIGNTWKD